MTREQRVRLSDAEKGLVEDVRDERYGEEVAEDIPLGKVIGQVMQEELSRQRGDGGD